MEDTCLDIVVVEQEGMDSIDFNCIKVSEYKQFESAVCHADHF